VIFVAEVGDGDTMRLRFFGVILEVAEDRSTAEVGSAINWSAGRAFIEDLNENLGFDFELDLIFESESSSKATRYCLLGFVKNITIIGTYFFTKSLIIRGKSSSYHCFGHHRAKFRDLERQLVQRLRVKGSAFCCL
jgi:hypothetical protein